MKLGFKRGQKGFTLVELMVVMAIMAVLASIVVPAVSGTKQQSEDTQVQQDASAVETAVGNYNSDANVAEMLTTDNATTVTSENGTQITSSRWPEVTVTTNYSIDLPPGISTVTSVTIKDYDGNTIYATGGGAGVSLGNFVSDYTAIDMAALSAGGYMTEEPRGFTSTFTDSEPFHNYLWLLEKVATEESSQAGRVVAIFGLVEIAANGSTYTLTYQRVY